MLQGEGHVSCNQTRSYVIVDIGGKHVSRTEQKIMIIIKITISSIVIGLKNSYFPLIHLSSCYRTVCYGTVQ